MNLLRVHQSQSVVHLLSPVMISLTSTWFLDLVYHGILSSLNWLDSYSLFHTTVLIVTGLTVKPNKYLVIVNPRGQQTGCYWYYNLTSDHHRYQISYSSTHIQVFHSFYSRCHQTQPSTTGGYLVDHKAREPLNHRLRDAYFYLKRWTCSIGVSMRIPFKCICRI